MGKTAVASDAKSAQWWEQRVFRNTYTHHGRLVRGKRWSVKIQHAGVRRTLSLKALKRADAAREAAELYRTIVAEGWTSVTPVRGGDRRTIGELPDHPAAGAWPETDVRYWENRLLQRRYPVPADPQVPRDWSVRVEHDGESWYFPLGTTDTHEAATRALAIYRTVVTQNWEAAFVRHPREVTLGLHWVSNPVIWTYTTFHTEMTDWPVHPARPGDPVLRVAIVEADGGTRRALKRWINAQPGVRCVAAFATAEEVFQRAAPSQQELWMINYSLPGMTGSEVLERIQKTTPGVCGLVYSAYEDSEDLFISTPGSASGYVYRRTPPDRILEAVAGLGGNNPPTSEQIGSHVRRYFEEMIKSLPAHETAAELARLTHRELEVLSLLSRGCVDKEIADALHISAWTVHGHVKNIFEKLGVHSRTEAVVKYLQK